MDGTSTAGLQRWQNPRFEGQCRSCGRALEDTPRRFCSPKCRKGLTRWLDHLQVILKAMETWWAIFSWTEAAFSLRVVQGRRREVLWYWHDRRADTTPADGVMALNERLGNLWHDERRRGRSRDRAATAVIEGATHTTPEDPSFAPSQKVTPGARRGLGVLGLAIDDLQAPDASDRLKRAFRQCVMHTHAHPDHNGSAEDFVRIKQSFDDLRRLLESESDSADSRLAVADGWLYDASRRRWSPPL